MRFKKIVSLIILCIVIIHSAGCTTLSLTEKHRLNELKVCGIPEDEQSVKHPGLAGALNILPGFGNFYLAIGTNESDHWVYGFLNLLTWPISIIWGVPEAAIDANNINKRYTVYYYTYDPYGKKLVSDKCPSPTNQFQVTSGEGKKQQ